MTLVTLVGEHLDVLIMFVVMVCCSGIKLYMKCVALVYTGLSKVCGCGCGCGCGCAYIVCVCVCVIFSVCVSTLILIGLLVLYNLHRMYNNRLTG